ncbi:MAG TPA: hypothetical protein VG273_16370 [Bryobacteraceae bacterium]|nr:hypothetical protein [Bryobacteraceae bacterium]
MTEEKLTERQYRALMATAIGLSPDQIARLSPAQIAWLSPDQIAWLSPDQIARLSPDQIAWLSPDQIARLSPAQIARLSPAQIAWLSPEGLSRHKELWESVPAVQGLYSQIAADIADAKRRLDQSTFGPYREEPTICDSPMCIAGHTVNRAGAAGYALLRKLDHNFAAAAALIHAKSCPDVPRPRYDSYPNEWALAYIQERAAEESQGRV